MKNILLTCCALPLFFSPQAAAGINGTYNVRGTETDNGDKFTFTGTVKISSFKSGSYNLKFNDGENTSFNLTFSKPLKETTATQTVNGSSSKGTGTATFRYVGGHYKVEFNYKAKGADVKGSGAGIK